MEIKLKVDFVDMDKIILTRQSGDTFTIPNTKRNEEFFDFFHSEDKPQEQVNEDELWETVWDMAVDEIHISTYIKKCRELFSIISK